MQSVEWTRPGNTYELTVKTAMPKGAPIPRGRVTFPFEPKTKQRDTVLVFADGDDAIEAKKAGADIVGGVELVEPVSDSPSMFPSLLCTLSFWTVVYLTLLHLYRLPSANLQRRLSSPHLTLFGP
jgi:large subunit ribosomal protein L1